MKQYVKTPDVTVFRGFEVTKDTKIEFKSKNGKQKIENLLYTRWEKIESKDFTQEIKTKVPLKEGTIILFQGDEQGYVVPMEQFKLIDEAIEDYEAMKEE